MNQYKYITTNCLFISHINNTHETYCNSHDGDVISTQEHIDRASIVSIYEMSITNIIKEFSIPSRLP